MQYFIQYMYIRIDQKNKFTRHIRVISTKEASANCD
jgi:hypothetical protein